MSVKSNNWLALICKIIAYVATAIAGGYAGGNL